MPSDIPFTATPGPTNAAADLQSDQPVDFVELILTQELLQDIVTQTNLYAEQEIQKLRLNTGSVPHSRTNAWRPITLPELKIFLGLFFLTGIIRKPQMKTYWCTDEMLATPYFNRCMSRNRFQIIWRFLHFTDNTLIDPKDPDRMVKVRPVLDYVVSKFRELYQPSANISIDEGMLLWRGRLSFRVYNPQKPIKYGIKSYVLCDSHTGYCYNLKPYSGDAGMLGDTVVSLLDRLKGQGYRLYMDNFYNSVRLCERLLDLNTHVCGTLRKHRGEPPEIGTLKPTDLERGETVSRHNERVLVLGWKDKKVIKMVTTLHEDKMEKVLVWQKGKQEKVEVLKPTCVASYNQYMSGVDKLDQHISYYPFVRKSAKWTKKFASYLFQICLFNAFVIFRHKNPQSRCSTFLKFIQSISREWTRQVHTEEERDGGGEDGDGGGVAVGQTPRAPFMNDPHSRLDAKLRGHELVKYPPTRAKKTPARRCRVCVRSNIRSETRYYCKACHVPLHVGHCYTVYHSRASYTE